MGNRIRWMGILLILAPSWFGELSYGQNDTLRFAFVTGMHFGRTTESGEPLTPDVCLRKTVAEIERRRAAIWSTRAIPLEK
jgi:hypothetical protein